MTSEYLDGLLSFGEDVLYEVIEKEKLKSFFIILRKELTNLISDYECLIVRTGMYKKYIYDGVEVKLNLRDDKGLKIAVLISLFSFIESVLSQGGVIYVLQKDVLSKYAREGVLTVLKGMIEASVKDIVREINALSCHFIKVDPVDLDGVILSLEYLKKNNLVIGVDGYRFRLSELGNLFSIC